MLKNDSIYVGFTESAEHKICWTMTILPVKKLIVGIVLAILWMWPLNASLYRLLALAGFPFPFFVHPSFAFLVIKDAGLFIFSCYTACFLLAKIQTVTLAPSGFSIRESTYVTESLLLDIPSLLGLFFAAMLLGLPVFEIMVTKKWPFNWLMLSAVPGVWLFAARLLRDRMRGGLFSPKVFPETVVRIVNDFESMVFALYVEPNQTPLLVVPCVEDLRPQIEQVLRARYPSAIFENGRVPFWLRTLRWRRKLPVWIEPGNLS